MKATDIIDSILSYSGLNPKSLSEKIGLDRPQAIYDIQKGKTKNISPNMADKITSVFSEINRIWLLTGEGEMIKDAEKSSLNSNSQNDNDMLQQGLLDAIKRRDRQMDELLEQQKRLISIIETLSGASNQSRVG